MAERRSRLSRPIEVMPKAVEGALIESGLMDAYRARPDYQQNDYLGWINRAKRPETKERRLQQMLSELERGDVYMKMDWRPGRSRTRRLTLEPTPLSLLGIGRFECQRRRLARRTGGSHAVAARSHHRPGLRQGAVGEVHRPAYSVCRTRAHGATSRRSRSTRR